LSTVLGQSLEKMEQMISMLQDELAATNREVLQLTLELEDRVARRTQELSQAVASLQNEIEERKQAEAQVKSLNEELESRAELLELMNEELDSFASTASHDLRSPLNQVKGYAQIMLLDSNVSLAGRDREYLEIISVSATKMSNLIDELLNFSRITRQELSVSLVQMGSIVEEALRDVPHEDLGREIVWQIAELPSVHADHALLRQVFVNLLSNAVKYTRNQTPARIEIGIQTFSARENVFYVRDNGAGFDPALAHRLFQSFQRLHRDEDYEGVGVGLSIVRRIIGRHHGRVWAESTVGHGATFYFSLPVTSPQS